MDQTQLQQQIVLYYSKLPADAQAMFSSMKWMEELGQISKIYKLTEEQIATLGTETTLVLLGIIGTTEYEDTLKSEIKIDDAGMKSMLAEIESKILSTVRPALASAFEKNTSDLAEEKYGGGQKLDERFAKLPKEVQQSISESNYQYKLYAIAQKHKLSINHMAALDEVTTKVMIGIIHPDKYEAELGANIDISKEEITEIVAEVNEEVLKNIREILKTHWGKEGASVTKVDNDEVPIPPYAKAPIAIVAKGSESKIYADSGVEIVKDDKVIIPKTEEKSMTMKENTVLDRSGIDIIKDTPVVSGEHILANTETEKKFLDGVENPVNVASSIIGDKLTSITKSGSATTDYTLPKITKMESTTTPSTPKPHDPYHEVIE